MSDLFDAASELEEFQRQRAITDARRAQPAAVATGYCLDCGEPVAAPRRWCNRECAERWERDNA